MKKRICISLIVLLLATVALSACGKKVTRVFNVGEYGKLNDPTQSQVIGNSDDLSDEDLPTIKANDGYKFIEWDTPAKEGNTYTYSAIYEKREYYLSENKEFYEFTQDIFKYKLILFTKTTNLKTGDISLRDENVGDVVFNDPKGILNRDYRGFGQRNSDVREFDTTTTLTVTDKEFFAEPIVFSTRFIKNRIPAESIFIGADGNDKTIGIKSERTIRGTNSPENTTFKECEFEILSVKTSSQVITGEGIAEFAYFEGDHTRFDLQTTDKVRRGHIISIQLINKRDPDIKSNILEIVVF